MIFTETKLKGAYIVEPERLADERGFFARTFCRHEFEQHGIKFDVVQCNISFNLARGTLRGMHYQAEPHAEAKLVRCTMGAVYDVIVDLRPASPTFRQWIAVELSADNRKMLYVPATFAHGFLTLTDNSEVSYQMSTPFEPGSARGYRWDDPALNIQWPSAPAHISSRDQLLPCLGK